MLRLLVTNNIHAVLTLAQIFNLFQVIIIRIIHDKLHTLHVAGEDIGENTEFFRKVNNRSSRQADNFAVPSIRQ